ncbi:GAF domain-containing protein [Kutzneria sp. CA-103260]|uniref:GAF domain-containing protein n=1 Tax=Kutzneria sp. CA-103260 TaxID=2802641 RepID=UPI001BA83A1C|nr:GAF domain-containing protein [Kutzneria sp. CA-103260]QUQ62874.1 GAF domain protein [Kutzneria sp. CA-103260]
MTRRTGQNLLGPLRHVTTFYRGPATPGPAAGHIELGFHGPWLGELAGELRDAQRLDAVLPKVLDGALTLMGAEAGNIQLLDRDDDSLVLVTEFGFGAEFLDHFAVVRGPGSVCGRAAARGEQVVVEDVRQDPASLPHRGVFHAAGVRAVQSTPLLDRRGRMIGMVSTHRPEPGRPAELDLGSMRLYSQLAGEVVARHLAGMSPDVQRATG